MQMHVILVLFLTSFVLSPAHAYLPIIQDLKIEPASVSPSNTTGDYTQFQSYLEAAPKGVGARQAWLIEGGRGEYVNVVDIECGIQLKHEDLSGLYFLGANPWPGDDHGTAVYGIIRGSENQKGVTGIAHRTSYGFVGFKEGMNDPAGPAYNSGMVNAIRIALEKMNPGDVLVIEQHVDGPDKGALTLPEYYPEIFNALKSATDRGIHCVAAAGNGGSNLDADAYQGAFDLKKRDSGCIVVGAGSATTHERLYFSNYGSRVDARGFGAMVYSTGYGDLFNGGKTRTYTSNFSGTSSATPIVAGAVAVISSIAKAQGRLLTPIELREALRNTGTPQAGNAKLRIGNLPNIPEALKYLKINTR